MGWSIDTAIKPLRDIFKKEGRSFRLSHPMGPYPTVDIAYSVNGMKDISDLSKQAIIDLFPEVIYINFIKLDGHEEMYTWTE